MPQDTLPPLSPDRNHMPPSAPPPLRRAALRPPAPIDPARTAQWQARNAQLRLDLGLAAPAAAAPPQPAAAPVVALAPPLHLVMPAAMESDGDDSSGDDASSYMMVDMSDDEWAGPVL